MSIKIGFFGSRVGLRSKQEILIENYLREICDLVEDIFITGCGSADWQFSHIARKICHKGKITMFLPKNKFLVHHNNADIYTEPLHEQKRNIKLIEDCDIVFTAPATVDEKKRSRTWQVIRHAKKIHKPFIIFAVNGSIVDCL